MTVKYTRNFFQVTIVRLSSYDDATDYEFNEEGELSYHTLNSETAFKTFLGVISAIPPSKKMGCRIQG